jgi:hypothetical protein
MHVDEEARADLDASGDEMKTFSISAGRAGAFVSRVIWVLSGNRGTAEVFWSPAGLLRAPTDPEEPSCN